MDNQSKLPLVIIGLLAIAVGGFLFFKKQAGPKISGEVFDAAIKTNTQELDPTRIPPAFPSDLPLEQGVLLENQISENQVPNTNTFKVEQETQSTRKYISQKSLEENYEIFGNYLSQNNWKVVYKLDEKNVKAYMAKKEGVEGMLKVSISKNTLTQDVMVELSIVK